MKKNYDYEKVVQLNHNEIAAKIDLDTGEITEIPNTVGNNTRVETVDYTEYIMLNVPVLQQLVKVGVINRIDKGYIVEMSEMVKTEFNALFNKQNNPHTINTLSEQLEVHYDRMTKLLKKYVKIGVLGKLTTQDRTMYVMNPFLGRRRKYVSKETTKIFPDFKKN